MTTAMQNLTTAVNNLAALAPTVVAALEAPREDPNLPVLTKTLTDATASITTALGTGGGTPVPIP